MKNGKQNLKRILKNPFVQKGIFTLSAFFFLALVWIVAYACVGNDYLFPSLGDTLKESFRLLTESAFYKVLFPTLLRAFLAFLISFVFAGGFAVISYTVGGFSRFFAPIISFLRSLPTMAVLLMILLWTSATAAPVVVSCLGPFPMLYATFFATLSETDRGLLEMCNVYNVSTKERILKLYLPSIAPSVCKQATACLSFALKLTVSAEVMSNTFQSIGGRMQTASLYGEIPTLFALVLLTFVTGYLLECIGLLIAAAVGRRVR